MDVLRFVYLFIMCWTFALSTRFGYLKNATMNNHMHIIVWMCIFNFLGYMVLAGCIVNFLRNLQAGFHSVYAFCIPTGSARRFQSPPILVNTLSSPFLTIAIFVGVK